MLSPKAREALTGALLDLPDSRAPLCERMAQIRDDVLIPLSKRADFTTDDRELLTALTVWPLLFLTGVTISEALDTYRGVMRSHKVLREAMLNGADLTEDEATEALRQDGIDVAAEFQALLRRLGVTK